MARQPRSQPDYLVGLGTVSATTLMVRSKLEGELKSLGFEEGKPVEAGQLLATVETQEAQSTQTRRDLDLARQKFAEIQSRYSPEHPEYRRAAITLQELERASRLNQIRAPFPGIAGLRKIDPGNMVHTGDLIVVITQVQPIAVLFTIPQDNLPAVMARMREGATPTVEAWNRDSSARLSTGTLTAVDNEIDKSNGMATLKAAFDNKDGVLFPNQFVNVRLLLNGR
jgi:multidrug efflux system membrane fusion protein